MSNKIIFNSPNGSHEIVSSDGVFFDGGLQLSWGATDCGFGQATLTYDNESGNLLVDSEYMSKEFVKKALEKLIEDSVFSDFQKQEKTIALVSLEEANKAVAFVDNVLYIPFFIDEKGPIVQRRWKLSENKVLNIWFDKEKIKEHNTESLEFELKICEDKNFSLGFIKAEIWSFEIKKIKKV